MIATGGRHRRPVARRPRKPPENSSKAAETSQPDAIVAHLEGHHDRRAQRLRGHTPPTFQQGGLCTGGCGKPVPRALRERRTGTARQAAWFSVVLASGHGALRWRRPAGLPRVPARAPAPAPAPGRLRSPQALPAASGARGAVAGGARPPARPVRPMASRPPSRSRSWPPRARSRGASSAGASEVSGFTG